METGKSFQLKRALLCAILWCAMVSVAESMDQPVDQIGLHEQISFIILVGLNYVVPGLIWSLGAELPASRRKPLLAAIILLPTATAGSILSLRMLSPFFSHSSDMGEILIRPPLLDYAGHAFWANLFYGGMFAAAYHYIQKNIELRRKLGALRLLLGESEMRLREARLRRLHEQLRPTTLVQALEALQGRYTQDPAQGDRLFDALVAFLRVAMSGLRGGHQAGPNGASLIKAYVGLRNAIDPAIPRWRLVDESLHDAAPAAPAPRSLLEILDRVDDAIPSGPTIEILLSGSAADYAVRIRTSVEPEPAAFRGLLKALERLDARVSGRPSPGIILEVLLHAPPVSDRLRPASKDQASQQEGERHVTHVA